MPDAVTIAQQVAKRIAYRSGGRYDWRELWGAAWEGVVRNNRPDTAYIASRRHVYNVLDQYHRRQKPRRVSVELQTFDIHDSHPPAPAEIDGPQTELQAWIDTYQLRSRASWRTRVWMYLWAVEGIGPKEIAKLFGVSRALVKKSFQEFREELGRTE